MPFDPSLSWPPLDWQSLLESNTNIYISKPKANQLSWQRFRIVASNIYYAIHCKVLIQVPLFVLDGQLQLCLHLCKMVVVKVVNIYVIFFVTYDHYGLKCTMTSVTPVHIQYDVWSRRGRMPAWLDMFTITPPFLLSIICRATICETTTMERAFTAMVLIVSLWNMSNRDSKSIPTMANR